MEVERYTEVGSALGLRFPLTGPSQNSGVDSRAGTGLRRLVGFNFWIRLKGDYKPSISLPLHLELCQPVFLADEGEVVVAHHVKSVDLALKYIRHI